jgi:phosphomannomutase
MDVHVAKADYPGVKERLLVVLTKEPPASLAGQPVVRTQTLDTGDGSKFFVADGSWMLVRTSGTEPLVRVYTEATSPEIRDAMVGEGERLVREA